MMRRRRRTRRKRQRRRRRSRRRRRRRRRRNKRRRKKSEGTKCVSMTWRWQVTSAGPCLGEGGVARLALGPQADGDHRDRAAQLRVELLLEARREAGTNAKKGRPRQQTRVRTYVAVTVRFHSEVSQRWFSTG